MFVLYPQILHFAVRGEGIAINMDKQVRYFHLIP
jgi:hypothetical protein